MGILGQCDPPRPEPEHGSHPKRGSLPGFFEFGLSGEWVLRSPLTFLPAANTHLKASKIPIQLCCLFPVY